MVFSVNLPTASQNSLLIVQSTSPVVRAQFAGWFVYTMSGEGYNINAEIVNITTVVRGRTLPMHAACRPCHAGLLHAAADSSLSLVFILVSCALRAAAAQLGLLPGPAVG